MTAENEERNAELLDLYVRGRTVDTLSKHFGLAPSTVQEIIARHRAKQGPRNKAEQIERAADQLDHLIERAMKMVELEGAPVTAGKDGTLVVDPEATGPDGKPVYVRDYSARFMAMDRVRTLQERKAKLLGLDSATKTEVSGEVSYHINGLDPGKLT